MANSWKTLGDGDVVRKSLASFLNKIKFGKTLNHEYDNRFANSGAKNGGTLLIKNPQEFTVRSGAIMQVQDIAQTTQSLTVGTQFGVDLDYSTLEATMSIDDYEKEVIEPAMDTLVAYVDYYLMTNIYKDIFNLSGTAATDPASLTAVLNANTKLSQGLAPDTNRYIIMNSVAMAGTVASMSTYFHKASELERSFTAGYIGEAAGMKWMESNMVPSHTNGTRTDVSPVVNTSTGITSGSSSISVTAAGNAVTYAAGDVFTIENVYAINRQTKGRYAHLQQFVVTTLATSTAGGAVTLVVSPTPTTSGAKQNVEIVSAGASKVVTATGAGSSGTASSVYTQNMAYHKDFATWVSADLYTDPSQRMSKAVIDGVSMRIWRSGDIINDRFPVRLDVIIGYKTLRPEWAVRVRG